MEKVSAAKVRQARMITSNFQVAWRPTHSEPHLTKCDVRLRIPRKRENPLQMALLFHSESCEYAGFRYYGAPRSLFIRILLDGADNFLVVKPLAVKSGLRPAKLPDIRPFFAGVSLHRSALHPILLRRRCGVEESSDIEPKGRGWRKQSSELLCGGNSPASCRERAGATKSSDIWISYAEALRVLTRSVGSLAR